MSPECVGLSLSLVDDNITLTLATTALEVLPLDAIQYLASGPCVEAFERSQIRKVDRQADNEERWSLYARATAAQGVLSSLSIPLLDGSRVRESAALRLQKAAAQAGIPEVEVARTVIRVHLT